MATAAGYQGYGSPERAKVDRERRLAELLQQGALDTGPKSLWEGVAQLGKAFIARDAMGRADKAEGEYGDSQRRAFDLLSSQMFPDSAGTASVSQAPTPGSGDAKARLMAKANPEGTDPHAAMAAPQTAPGPAPAADPNAITKTDLPPLPQASPGVAAIAEALSRQGGPVSPYMQEYAQPGQPAPAAPPMAQPAPQMQPQAAPQAGMNPTARIAGALMAQPPMQKPAPQRQTGGMSPDNIRAGMQQVYAMTGDMQTALSWGQAQEQQQYARGRDTMEDQRWDAQFGFQKDRAAVGDQQWGEQFGFQKDRAGVQDSQWGQQFDFQQGRAEVGDQQWGAEFGESKRQFDARMAAEKAAADAKAAAAASGGAVFEGPQLATIYNKNMDVLDAATEYQGTLDLVANTAKQFIDQSKDWNSQGEGFWNDIGQALSMETSDLKALTNRIAPLMRQPGSGASSDKDVEMFRSSVVNINNTPDANQRFAKGAAAMAKRNQQYVEFLTQTINPQDPQSRQKAQQLWNIYKSDQPIFLENGAVNEVVAPFSEWLSSNMRDIQVSPSGMPTGKRTGQIGDGPAAAMQSVMTQAPQVDTPPPGIDPEDWKYMSPEDKAKFRR